MLRRFVSSKLFLSTAEAIEKPKRKSLTDRPLSETFIDPVVTTVVSRVSQLTKPNIKIDLSVLSSMFPLSLDADEFSTILKRITTDYVFSEITSKNKHYQYCFKASDLIKAIAKDESFVKSSPEDHILFGECNDSFY
jgi:hypothetical protein